MAKVDDGPLLLHLTCKQLNPFWKDNIVDLPVNLHYKTDANGDVTAPLRHWQIDAMRDVPTNYLGNSPMWFPQALFRAFHEGKEVGGLASTVLLLGGQAAGKSVLATMALRAGTWRGMLWNGGAFRTSGYVYVSPDSEVAVKYLNFVDNLGALIRNGNGDLIAETGDNERNIRALFISYDAKTDVVATETPGGLELFNRSNVRETIRKTFTLLWAGGTARTQSSKEVEIPAPISAVVFYDLKGEFVDRATGKLVRLIQSLGRLAIVMSADDLTMFGPREDGRERRNSADVAIEMMERVQGFNKPICLIVTHVDKARQKPSPQGWAAYWKPHNGDPRAYVPASASAEREVLCGVLSQGNDTERGIAALLTLRKWPVYFVWTENVSTPERLSVGTQNFVANWCAQGLKSNVAGR